jgi:hypothetical protein
VVISFVEVNPTLIVASIWGEEMLKMIDRKTHTVIKEFHQISEVRNNNQIFRTLNYNEENYPYLIIKDTDKISLINIKTLESITMVSQDYQTQSWEFSMI